MVLTTIGSLGDLYPVLSLARALEARGIETRLALSPDDCEMARRWGLLATPIGPSEAEVCAALGLTRDEIAAAVLKDPGPLIRDALMPLLPDMAREIAALCDRAGCVAGTTFALGGSLAAEMTGTPYVPLILQPFMALAPSDPPRGGTFRYTRRPAEGWALAWNRAYLGLAHRVLRWRHGRALTRVRRGLGLPPQPGTPLLDHGADVPLRLGLWSPRFSPLPADAPPKLTLAGFPPAPEGTLPPEVRRWISEGPAPLVVTLGSIAQGLGRDDFWQEAAAMARTMGLRAVLLHGDAPAPEGPDLLPLRYGAHAELFPQAAAIVHHGGIGTTAEALRSGRPQLVLPVGGDQPDNAARLERMGAAVTMPVLRFTGAAGATLLSDFLQSYPWDAAADRARALTEEDGAAMAARLLESIVLER
ncbi:glycosyltransferase [Jannaschia seohaensis]|uniref:UDP:flavonoid glycosyltransferase YjiC (YdhE family) n=1 Tax=Jannaschia seohaensis TaxID=475081 RepID=A0A2Y9B8D6_9RHOB|nr:glycosyltransferase [Jannaschia seohaensis]PWJ12144.1 UDP:flavonoid glycosyltransferase YjiC (YdhE family) [Jannaschia seohaensis]SSA51247.1 UDP:flavonoid glycosyltransferase YjiC, YdhE family [Jannaschia seohaensis]